MLPLCPFKNFTFPYTMTGDHGDSIFSPWIEEARQTDTMSICLSSCKDWGPAFVPSLNTDHWKYYWYSFSNMETSGAVWLMLWVWKTTVSGAKTSKNCPWHLWLMVHFSLTQILTLIWTALVFADALLFFSLPIPLQDTILYDNLKHCTVWRWSLDQSNNVASLHHCFLHRGHTAE